MIIKNIAVCSAVPLLLFTSQVLACATCGCSLSSDAALGYGSSGGWGISIDNTLINQNQLRAGTRTIPAQQVQEISGQEVEQSTVNHITTVDISYAPAAEWSFKVSMPYIDRSHATFGADASVPLSQDQLSYAHPNGIGDMKLMSSYQGFLPAKNLGVQLGIKLPTGNYGGVAENNTDGTAGHGSVGHYPAVFGPTGNSASTYLDTSLNTGNGSTDVIVGAYYFQPVSQDFDAFINSQVQFPVWQKLNQSGADFRPGSQASISFGLRYAENPKLIPQVQINLTRKNADRGALADEKDTAGDVAYVSPGVTMQVMQSAQLYAFIQVPVYSNLSGYQLFPRYTASVGLSYHF